MLLEEGHDVFCFRRDTSDMSRVEDIKDQVTWFSVADDILNSMQKSSIDYVINMACSYGKATVSDETVIESNLSFPLRILTYAVKAGVKFFITMGTGLPDDFNIYSFSKMTLNDYGRYYSNKSGISYICLKTEMFYGPDEPSDRFFPSIIRKMINGEEVDVTKGTQKRDIISSDDVVKAIMMTIYSDLSGYVEIPVGTGDCPVIADVVDYIWNETGRKSKVNYGAVPMRPFEPDCVADVTRIRQLGEWEPVLWKNGITAMINELRGVE